MPIMSDLRSKYNSADNAAAATLPKTPTTPSFAQTDNFTSQHDNYSPSSAISSRLTTADDATENATDYKQQQQQTRKPKPPVSIARHGNGQHVASWGTRPGTSTSSTNNNRSPWSLRSPSRQDDSKRHSGMSSRPASRTATHVPSLAQPAFLRPMSSQRLQAQRGMRLSAREGTYGGGGGSIMSRPRNSMRLDEPPPPSRATDNTEHTDDAKLGHGNRFGSLGDNVRPLQYSGQQQTNLRRLELNLDEAFNRRDIVGDLPSAKSPRSPRSFSSRLSFSIPSRNNASNSGLREMGGREKLSSRSSSMPPIQDQQPHQETPEAPFVNVNAGKNHQYFDGNTRFWAGGRLQNARDRPVNIVTGLLAVLPGVLFFIFSASWLWHNISPAIPLVFAYIYYICISSFIHASVSDPGILPRNLQRMPPPDENEDLLRLAPSTTDWVVVKSAASENAAMEMPVKYCKTCNLWRPPRGHHCRICNNCIDTHDHHCVWLNNCVGRRNYRYFFTFVASGTLMGIYLFGACLTQILVYMSRTNISFGAAINTFRVPFAMCIYALLATPYPITLTAYHVFLMARGETTREYLNSHKFIPAERHRAFTQGNILLNWIVVLCRPRPPSFLDFKRSYQEGDQRFGEKRAGKAKDAQVERRAGVEMQKLSPGLVERGFQGPNGRQMRGHVQGP